MATPNLKKIREEKGLKVKEVAKDLKCSDKFIYAVESGKRVMPIKGQIYYLKMRGLEIDLINAKYLQERLNERKVDKNDKRFNKV